MREILFRGKRCDTGEWVQGFYVRADHHWHNHGVHKEWIICGASANGGWFALHNKYAVKAETVGQFTGLTDKNGKKIFEGDILKFHKFKGEPDWTGFVKYDISMFVIEGEQPVDNGGFEIQLCSIDRKRCEVIGNIHDNPELLEIDHG